jgi:hypothetical protein
MPPRIRIEGYAIVSADAMIADRNRLMPDGLKIEADVRFFNEGLDSAAVVVHGRHSHEQQAVSDRRWRLIGWYQASPGERNAVDRLPSKKPGIAGCLNRAICDEPNGRFTPAQLSRPPA